MNLRTGSAAALVGLVVCGMSTVAGAEGEVDPEAVRLSQAGHTVKWNWTPPGKADRFGHAETLVHAPLSAVRQVVLDFPHYKDLTKDGIRTARVVGHQPDGSVDVYIQMGAMNDMLTFWNVTRFAPVRTASDGVQVLEGRMVPGKGNIDDSAVVWTLRPVGNDFTVLKMDVLLRPGLPAPQSLIDNELRESAARAVDSVHDKAQGSPEPAKIGG